jgi:hypothetical protein
MGGDIAAVRPIVLRRCGFLNAAIGHLGSKNLLPDPTHQLLHES